MVVCFSFWHFVVVCVCVCMYVESCGPRAKFVVLGSNITNNKSYPKFSITQLLSRKRSESPFESASFVNTTSSEVIFS